MKRLEELSKRGFYTMAMIRTVVCIIFLAMTVCSCSTADNLYSEASWMEHKIHFAARVENPKCFWCSEYNRNKP